MDLWVRNFDPRMIDRIAHDPVLQAQIIHKMECTVSATSEDFEHLYPSPPPRSNDSVYVLSVHPGETPVVLPHCKIPINVGDEFYDSADTQHVKTILDG